MKADPEFSRKAAAVMNSTAVLDAPAEEQWALREAFASAQSIDDLPEHLRPLMDDAVHEKLQEAYAEHLHPRNRLGKWMDKPVVFADPGDEYRGSHRAPERSDESVGSSLDDPTSAFGGNDIYGPNGLRYYGSGGHDPETDKADRESLAAILKARGKPDMKVTVYRAVPNVKTNAEKIEDLEQGKREYLRRNNVPSRFEYVAGTHFIEWASEQIDHLKSQPEVDPTDVSIQPGDWVTASRTYAKQHGVSNLGGYKDKTAYKIVSKKVRAGDLFTDGDLNEWGWSPTKLQEAAAHFEEHLHPRGRGGRFIRVHFHELGKPSVVLGNVRMHLNGIEGERVDSTGRLKGVLHDYHPDEVKRVTELRDNGPGKSLTRREWLTDGPAKEHLDLAYLAGEKPWIATLTNDEQDALRVYVSPDGFQAVNKSLRSGDPSKDSYAYMNGPFKNSKGDVTTPETTTTRTIDEWASLIDSAMVKAPATDAMMALFVYRGVRDKHALFGAGGPKVGDRITDKAYTSTTTDVDMARNFAESPSSWEPDKAPAPALLEIVAPPGVKGAWMASIFSSGFLEFTLPRGQTFEVTDVREELGKEVGTRIPVVEMRLVPDAVQMGDPGSLDARHADDFAAAYDGFAHAGLRAHVHQKVQVNPPDATTMHALTLVEVIGSIFDDSRSDPVTGEPYLAGAFSRQSKIDDEGNVVVHHDNLTLKPEYQGRGWATAFNRHAWEGYRRGGVTKVRVDTAAVGGYAWARAGYDFDIEIAGILAPVQTSRMNMIGDELYTRAYWVDKLRAERMTTSGGSVAAARRERESFSTRERARVPAALWDEFVSKLPTPERMHAYADGDTHALEGIFRTPAEIAAFGREHTWTEEDDRHYMGQEMWLGKRFMLSAHWSGVKNVDKTLIEAAAPADLLSAVSEVYDSWGARGDLHDPPDDVRSDDDLGFWDEVEARLVSSRQPQ